MLNKDAHAIVPGAQHQRAQVQRVIGLRQNRGGTGLRLGRVAARERGGIDFAGARRVALPMMQRQPFGCYCIKLRHMHRKRVNQAQTAACANALNHLSAAAFLASDQTIGITIDNRQMHALNAN